MCDGRHDARAAYLKDDVFEYRRHLLGGKFEGNGEARSLARVAEHVLIPLFVDLYNDAVGPVLLMSPLSLPRLPIGDASLDILRANVMRIYLEAEIAQIIQLFGLGLRYHLARLCDVVDEHVEFAARGNRRVELADGGRGDVAGVCIRRLACLGLCFV